MSYKLAIGSNWQGKPDFKSMLERARRAEQAGVHAIWVPEAWGPEPFSTLALLAEHTQTVQLGTAIVNIYSRSPAALAQHFATLDVLSGGRMIAGLGTSGANVIEHFHGMPFSRPLTRMREYVDIINLLVAGTPLHYEGKIFRLGRGFTLRFQPPRKHIPIFIAALNPNSVRFTAQKADGWMPMLIPLPGLEAEITAFRHLAQAAGRDPKTLAVQAPGWIHVTTEVERVQAQQKASIAFYCARMGVYYSNQLARFGFGDEVARIKAAWASGGSTAAIDAVSPRLHDAVAYAGDLDGARARLAAQHAAGVDIHRVEFDSDLAPAAFEKLARALVG